MCRSSWFDDSVNVGASSFHAAPSALPEPALHVSFDDVPQVVEDDCVSDKSHPSEGLLSVLRFVFQLCPSVVTEAPPQPQRTCDFEGLLGTVPKPGAAEGPISLFYCVTELVSESLV